jgi:AcrR family transcriptional regulator
MQYPRVMDSAVGLRERKKRERREHIAATALELFGEQGYAATTVAEIARAADVSTRTVSLYFPAKEDLVFAGSDATLARLQSELATRAKDETFAEAMRRWLTGELALWQERPADITIQRRLIDAEPALQAVELRNRARVHAAIAEAIADDFSMDPDELEAQMVAAATIAIFDVLGSRLRGGEGHGSPELADGVLELLDRALVFVRAGMQALSNE